MKYREFGRAGLQVSILGFGASPLGNEFGTIDAREGERAVHASVDAGINLFDVAPYYGRTLAEERLGAALQGRRHKVVLATKCGRYDKNSFDFSKERVKTSVDESLRRLRTDYIDLLTAHDIEFGDREQIINETIPSMRELQSEGKIRHVGISGLPLRMLADVAKRAHVEYVLSYCHYNLLVRDLDRWLLSTIQENQIGLINASPLHMGVLAPGGPPSWHPASREVKNAGAKIVQLCQKHSVDPAVMGLRFCLNHPVVSSTLVGMSSVHELTQDIRAIESDLPTDLMAEIEKIAEPVRDRTWPSGRPENSDV